VVGVGVTVGEDGLDVKKGVLVVDGNRVGDAPGVVGLRRPENRTAGTTRIAMRITTIAAMIVCDFLSLGGGDGGGNWYSVARLRMRKKFFLIINVTSLLKHNTLLWIFQIKAL
jgi:hypothetical protein